MFCKKGALKNFAKSTGKHMCQSFFFNKVASIRLATLFKNRLWHMCFPVNFRKFLRTPFFIEYLLWVLLAPGTKRLKIEKVAANVFQTPLHFTWILQIHAWKSVTRKIFLPLIVQPAFTCSKSASEQCVKTVQSQQ